MYNVMLFAILVNTAVWLISVFALVPFGLPAEYAPTDIASMFSLNLFKQNFMFAGIGVAAGIAGLLLRQNTFALYALVIFAVAAFVPIVGSFVYAVPNMIDAIFLLYPDYNPVWISFLGAQHSVWGIVFVGVQSFAAFIFIMDKVTGGQTA
jgi:hypothetical protein